LDRVEARIDQALHLLVGPLGNGVGIAEQRYSKGWRGRSEAIADKNHRREQGNSRVHAL
jgi:hypothetical protein